METLIAEFFSEALAAFVILPMDDLALDRSIDLVLEDNLRTLDSLQLSAALALHDEIDALRFIC